MLVVPHAVALAQQMVQVLPEVLAYHTCSIDPARPGLHGENVNEVLASRPDTRPRARDSAPEHLNGRGPGRPRGGTTRSTPGLAALPRSAGASGRHRSPTSAAGDSMTAGVAAVLGRGGDLAEAVRTGAAGGLTVTRLGLGTGRAEAIRELLTRVRFEPLCAGA